MRLGHRDVWMLDNKDISNSYILYFIAVIAIAGFLLLGGLLLWIH
jgi:hypothetical protein